MNKLEDILSRKAALTERIASQRQRLAADIQAVQPLLTIAGQGAAILAGLRRHSAWLAAAAGVLLVLKPKRSMAWLRRGLIAWRTWQWLRSTLRPLMAHRHAE